MTSGLYLKTKIFSQSEVKGDTFFPITQCETHLDDRTKKKTFHNNLIYPFRVYMSQINVS